MVVVMVMIRVTGLLTQLGQFERIGQQRGGAGGHQPVPIFRLGHFLFFSNQIGHVSKKNNGTEKKSNDGAQFR